MAKRPYLETVRYRQTLDELACEETLKPSKETLNVSREHRDTVKRNLHVFGFSTEYLKRHLFPMLLHGKEPLGSMMGNDAALAIVSHEPKL